MEQQETIAVLGAGGTMGRAMARNLAAAGHAVRAWNRTRDRIEVLTDDGITICDTPAEAAAGASTILTMLSNADVVLEAMADVHAAPDADAPVLWLQMSTIGEAGIGRCIELAEAHSLVLIDAPVSGTKQPAIDGKLIILASGPDSARERADRLFGVVGQRTVWAGRAGAGSQLKVVVNAWLLSIVEGLAETLALTEGIGLDPALFLEAVTGGPLDLPFLQLKAKAMLAQDFDPQFALKHAHKDAVLATESAREHGLDLPLLDTIAARMGGALAAHGDEDLSVTYLTSRPGSA